VREAARTDVKVYANVEDIELRVDDQPQGRPTSSPSSSGAVASETSPGAAPAPLGAPSSGWRSRGSCCSSPCGRQPATTA
jgi:hypothetical protein